MIEIYLISRCCGKGYGEARKLQNYLIANKVSATIKRAKYRLKNELRDKYALDSTTNYLYVAGQCIRADDVDRHMSAILHSLVPQPDSFLNDIVKKG
jgi:hypothetical protein